jgi:GTP-binding protein
MSCDPIKVLANRFFEGHASFLKGCVKPEHFPDPTLPEVAFIGRSNVGKSSLINALLNRRALARTSNMPGRTREINYFHLNPPKSYLDFCNDQSFNALPGLYLVDLPGYGFAKAKKDVASDWEKVCSSYLANRISLKRVYILIDSRHGFKKSDTDLCALLDAWAVSYQLILTKADKISKNDQMQMKTSLVQKISSHGSLFTACFPEILMTSSQKKEGIETVKSALYRAIHPIQQER